MLTANWFDSTKESRGERQAGWRDVPIKFLTMPYRKWSILPSAISREESIERLRRGHRVSEEKPQSI